MEYDDIEPTLGEIVFWTFVSVFGCGGILFGLAKLLGIL